MSTLKKKLFDYFGQAAFIHLISIACLTPWLLLLVGLNKDQYITWLWQAFYFGLGL